MYKQNTKYISIKYKNSLIFVENWSLYELLGNPNPFPEKLCHSDNSIYFLIFGKLKLSSFITQFFLTSSTVDYLEFWVPKKNRNVLSNLNYVFILVAFSFWFLSILQQLSILFRFKKLDSFFCKVWEFELKLYYRDKSSLVHRLVYYFCSS